MSSNLLSNCEFTSEGEPVVGSSISETVRTFCRNGTGLGTKKDTFVWVLMRSKSSESTLKSCLQSTKDELHLNMRYTKTLFAYFLQDSRNPVGSLSLFSRKFP